MAKNRLINEDTIANGDLAPGKAGGFRAETANGTAQWMGTGWNLDYTSLMTMGQVPPGPTRPTGRSNRTAE